jgi:hypothetical protein
MCLDELKDYSGYVANFRLTAFLNTFKKSKKQKSKNSREKVLS